jgi:hypothetical protein
VETIACDLADVANHQALWSRVENQMPEFT